mgnify:CR=1 FL=1
MSSTATLDETRRLGRHAAGATAQGKVEELIERLNEAVERAERVTERLQGATEAAERSIAVANELRQDVGSLIGALQRLATEVDAQIHDRTAALMATIATADEQTERARAARVPIEEISSEVSALIEELRATAEDISTDLEGKSDELRQLIEEAVRTKSECTTRRQTGVAKPVTIHVRQDDPKPFSAPREEPHPSIRERADAVRDDVQVTYAPRVPEQGRYSQAIELAGLGLGADEIARRCGLGREEVRMLLRLHSTGIKEWDGTRA